MFPTAKIVDTSPISARLQHEVVRLHHDEGLSVIAIHERLYDRHHPTLSPSRQEILRILSGAGYLRSLVSLDVENGLSSLCSHDQADILKEALDSYDGSLTLFNKFPTIKQEDIVGLLGRYGFGWEARPSLVSFSSEPVLVQHVYARQIALNDVRLDIKHDIKGRGRAKEEENESAITTRSNSTDSLFDDKTAPEFLNDSLASSTFDIEEGKIDQADKQDGLMGLCEQVASRL